MKDKKIDPKTDPTKSHIPEINKIILPTQMPSEPSTGSQTTEVQKLVHNIIKILKVVEDVLPSLEEIVKK